MERKTETMLRWCCVCGCWCVVLVPSLSTPRVPHTRAMLYPRASRGTMTHLYLLARAVIIVLACISPHVWCVSGASASAAPTTTTPLLPIRVPLRVGVVLVFPSDDGTPGNYYEAFGIGSAEFHSTSPRNHTPTQQMSLFVCVECVPDCSCGPRDARPRTHTLLSTPV